MRAKRGNPTVATLAVPLFDGSRHIGLRSQAVSGREDVLECPGPSATRVIAMAGARETILKARLCPEPKHPRALATLLEAVALWQGRHVW